MPAGDNDFVIKVATVNGSGSASANGLLTKAIFRAGIPVSGKNLFPSNIQGLPTWYEIRASQRGHLARCQAIDLMLAMNPETYAQDLAAVSPGGYLLYDATWPREDLRKRDDVTVLGMPLAGMINERFLDPRQRTLLKNIAYVGAAAALIGLDPEILRSLLAERFAGKDQLIEANHRALMLGYDDARERFATPLPFRARGSDRTDGHVLMDGNTACALGCLYAGATVGAWYPITPSTSLMDAFQGLCNRYRVDADSGERRFEVIQAEDELAAIGMVLGANWAGARAFTSTSGPGISLMSELIGFAYYTEIPAVIFDIQRCGPSTGMPTRTQQADVLAAALASHGDGRHPLLLPADPAECFEMTLRAFDLAERLQTPVFVMSDLDIGMNEWMIPTLQWDEGYAPDRGKVLTADDLEAMPVYHRYEDVDGDAIPYRTLPGVHAKGAYFLRGSGHDRHGRYTEDPEQYQAVVDRLGRKLDTARRLVPEPAVTVNPGLRTGVVAFGSSHQAVCEARERLAADGIDVNYLRLRGYPFGEAVEQFLDRHDRIFVVEQNRDAQLRALLIMDTRASQDKLISVLHYDGTPIDADTIVEAIAARMRKGAVA